MATTFPNITPATGLVEGDEFTVTFRPIDADGNSVEPDDVTLRILNDFDEAATVVDIGDMTAGEDASGFYLSYVITVGPRRTIIQFESASAIVKNAIAFFDAEPLQIAQA